MLIYVWLTFLISYITRFITRYYRNGVRTSTNMPVILPDARVEAVKEVERVVIEEDAKIVMPKVFQQAFIRSNIVSESNEQESSNQVFPIRAHAKLLYKKKKKKTKQHTKNEAGMMRDRQRPPTTRQSTDRTVKPKAPQLRLPRRETIEPLPIVHQMPAYFNPQIPTVTRLNNFFNKESMFSIFSKDLIIKATSMHKNPAFPKIAKSTQQLFIETLKDNIKTLLDIKNATIKPQLAELFNIDNLTPIHFLKRLANINITNHTPEFIDFIDNAKTFVSFEHKTILDRRNKLHPYRDEYKYNEYLLRLFIKEALALLIDEKVVMPPYVFLYIHKDHTHLEWAYQEITVPPSENNHHERARRVTSGIPLINKETILISSNEKSFPLIWPLDGFIYDNEKYIVSVFAVSSAKVHQGKLIQDSPSGSMTDGYKYSLNKAQFLLTYAMQSADYKLNDTCLVRGVRLA